MKVKISVLAIILLTNCLSIFAQHDSNPELARISQKSGHISETIQSLKTDAASEQQKASNAEMQVEILKRYFLDQKKIIARDPWRTIYGKTIYVMSKSSGFVKFSGQIQETIPNLKISGHIQKTVKNCIRVLGQFGDSRRDEYFVLDFPYHFGVGESIDPTKVYMAFEDGVLSYVTEDGYAKTIRKFNYGIPCSRPKDADSVELAAQLLTPDEEAQVNLAKSKAQEQRGIAVAAQKRLQDFLDKIEADHNAEIQRKKEAEAKHNAEIQQENDAKALALKRDQEEAEKGDSAALRRMGNRYFVGDGVALDFDKAKEYNKRAEAEEKKQAFAYNLAKADKGSLLSMVFIGKCYRDGNGVEKDLKKAREYFEKASAAGLAPPEVTKLLSTCK